MKAKNLACKGKQNITNAGLISILTVFKGGYEILEKKIHVDSLIRMITIL